MKDVSGESGVTENNKKEVYFYDIGGLSNGSAAKLSNMNIEIMIGKNIIVRK